MEESSGDETLVAMAIAQLHAAAEHVSNFPTEVRTRSAEDTEGLSRTPGNKVGLHLVPDQYFFKMHSIPKDVDN